MGIWRSAQLVIGIECIFCFLFMGVSPHQEMAHDVLVQDGLESVSLYLIFCLDLLSHSFLPIGAVPFVQRIVEVKSVEGIDCLLVQRRGFYASDFQCTLQCKFTENVRNASFDETAHVMLHELLNIGGKIGEATRSVFG